MVIKVITIVIKVIRVIRVITIASGLLASFLRLEFFMAGLAPHRLPRLLGLFELSGLGY